MTTKIVAVTSQQGIQVAKMANDKHISKASFQTALSDGSFGRFLDSIGVDVGSILPPDGGRIHFVNVTYDEGRPWKEAVTATGPNTPSNYDIWKVGKHYPPGPAGQVTKKLVLVNFGRTIDNAQPALDWAAKYRLPIASARATLAIPENHPTLHRTLGQNSMGVVSLEECQLSGGRGLPCGWWDGSGRRANLFWFDRRFYGRCWFAFLCDHNFVA